VAIELIPGAQEEYGHVCRLPWPADPEVPEGHVCECGRRWVYQPARWDALLTIEELRVRQEAGEFLRGIIPRFPSGPHHPEGKLARPGAADESGPAAGAVIVPIPTGPR
jgi:hypothetical protein